MERTWKDYTAWNKPGSEGYFLDGFIIYNVNRQKEWTGKGNSNNSQIPWEALWLPEQERESGCNESYIYKAVIPKFSVIVNQ